MKKILLFAAAASMAMSASADFFVVGASIDNQTSWYSGGTDTDPNYEVPGHMKDMGNGIWKWEGKQLGTGFKLNNGTWDDATNMGSNGSALEEGSTYELGVGGSTGNIALWGADEVLNPVVTLDFSNPTAPTITVEGEWVYAETTWFLAGFNGVWEVNNKDAACCFQATDEEDVFEIKGFEITVEEGEGKISSTGWAEEWGTMDTEAVYIDNDNLSQELEEVFGEAGNFPYVLTPAKYDVTWDYNTKTLTFVKEGTGAVEGLAADEVEYTYYNMQGVKVANPVNGIFVKVAGKKAAKVVK